MKLPNAAESSVDRAVFVALEVNLEANKDVLGLYASSTLRAELWLQILARLHNRCVQDLLIACVDGATFLI